METVVNSNSVITCEDILNSRNEVQRNISNKSPLKTSTSSPEKIYIPKGRPKSGKFWKGSKERASTLVKSRGLRGTWQKKELLRQELKRVKEKCRQRKQEQLAEKEAKKQRRRDNLKRQEENRKRSEIVQVIKNVNKLKRMKKKQLRNIEKRDTTVIQK